MRLRFGFLLLVGAAACVGTDPTLTNPPPPDVVAKDAGPDPVTPVTEAGQVDAEPLPVVDAGIDAGCKHACKGACIDGYCAEDVRGISAGDQFACAVTGDGALYCWGYNSRHELGFDNTTMLDCKRGPDAGPTNGCFLPKRVPLDDVVEAANGANHTCAVLRDGRVFCFGANTFGELGHASTNDAVCNGLPCNATPTVVAGLPPIRHIAAGEAVTCATTRADGKVICWGRNEHGRLGDGTIGSGAATAPKEVSGLPPIDGISMGLEPAACARTTAGGVYCWGVNYFGQAGHAPGAAPDLDCTFFNGPSKCAATPSKVAIENASQVAGLGASGCAVIGTAVHCWGSGIHQGLPCDQSTTPHPTPLAVQGLPPIRLVKGNYEHLCAVTTDGHVLCWGRDRFGNLGRGARTTNLCGAFATEPEPKLVPNLDGVVDIAVGAHFTLALRGDGSMMAWGYNVGANLGHIPGSLGDVADPTSLNEYYNATPKAVVALPRP